MDESRLPQHVVNRIERRWMVKFCEDADTLPPRANQFREKSDTLRSPMNQGATPPRRSSLSMGWRPTSIPR
jgi:hypothetical protein